MHLFQQGPRTHAVDVRREWNCSLPSVSYCWRSFVSTISHLLSLIQSVTSLPCPLVPVPYTSCCTVLLYFLRCQFSPVTQSSPTLCDPVDCSMPGLPVHHQLLDFAQTHVHWVGDAIQPSHPLSSPSPPALNLSQHQGLFQWISSLHQVAKVLEFQLQSFKVL